MSHHPDPSTIECRVSPWYFRRMVIVAFLFLCAAAVFGYQAIFAYPKSNEVAKHHAWFEDKIQATYYQHVTTGKLQQWYSTADLRGWPAGLYGQPPTWGNYAAESGLPIIPPKYRTDKEIRSRYYLALAGLLGVVITGFIAFAHGRLPLVADAESFTTANGIRIPFSAVSRIDRSQWDERGLAKITFDDQNGKVANTVIDRVKFEGADRILDLLVAESDATVVDAKNAGVAGVSDTAEQAV